jgi:hypothetical protein
MPARRRIAGLALGAVALGFLAVGEPAQAEFILTVEQVGSNVVAKGSGSINLTDTSGGAFGIVQQGTVLGNRPIIYVGSKSYDAYGSTISGQSVIGNSGSIGSSNVGDLAGLDPLFGVLLVSAG